jgi:hypothetical protein
MFSKKHLLTSRVFRNAEWSVKIPFRLGFKHHHILFPPKYKVKKEHVFLSIPCDLFRKKWFEIMDKMFMVKFHYHLQRL